MFVEGIAVGTDFGGRQLLIDESDDHSHPNPVIKTIAGQVPLYPTS